MDPAAQPADRVRFGLSVEVGHEDGRTEWLTLVGEDEAEPGSGLLSWTSPLAGALLNAEPGDEVVWRRPAGTQRLEILADSATAIEASRGLVYRAAHQYDRGERNTKLASMAKLKCGRLDREVTDACLQYWGGMGFTWEVPLHRSLPGIVRSHPHPRRRPRRRKQCWILRRLRLFRSLPLLLRTLYLPLWMSRRTCRLLPLLPWIGGRR